jgi:LPS-assembly protein
MRLPAFTDRRRRSPLQWVIIALLSTISAAAQAGWQCGEQPNGLWECTTPPAAIPADDTILAPPPTLEDTDTDVGEIVAPYPEESTLFEPVAPTVQATPDKSDKANTPVTTDTSDTTNTSPASPVEKSKLFAPPAPATSDKTNTPATTNTPPENPLGTETPGTPDATPEASDNTPAISATEPAATSSPVVTAPAVTATTQSHLIPQAKKMGRSRKDDVDIDRWALCPPFPQSPVSSPTANPDEIDMQADSAQASDGNVYTLNGNAVVLYGPQRLEASTITYRQDDNELTATGDLRFTAPGLIIDGEDATLYPDVEQGKLSNITYTLTEAHGRGTANVLNLKGRDNQQLQQASYTTCPPGNYDWELTAKEVDLDRADGTGTARNAKLAFKGVPILYTPYITFPIDDRRRSGLLVPKIGHTEETGADISVPYYWNIAPDKDAIITPRYMSDRGLMLGGEMRYLNEHNEGTLSAEYLPSDNRFNNEDRSLIAIEHYGNPWPRLQTSVVASNVSDDRYFEDLGSSLVKASQSNLERTAEANYHGSFWGLGLKLQDFQTVDPALTRADKPYKQLPQVVFNAAPESRLLGLKFSTRAEANYFTHSDGDIIKGTRVDVQPRISLPVHRAAWYLDPVVSLRHTAYDLDNTSPGEEDSPSRTTPIASLDAGSFFERSSHWGDTRFVQTLEPRLFYLYVPDKKQDDIPVFDTGDYDFNFWTLFRENRFSGPDRMGDANQVAVALTTRFLDPDNGVQRFSASLGSLFYFSDRSVTLPGEPEETDDSSNIVGEITLNLSRNWTAKSELQWNPHSSSTARSDQHLQYRAGPRKLVNLAYRYRDDIQEQTDISFLWPLSQSWHMVGRWYYSLKGSETIEALAGLGYESCCWGAQLVGRSFINNDSDSRNTAIFFQLEIKGLGRLGKKVDSALEHGILGYESSY